MELWGEKWFTRTLPHTLPPESTQTAFTNCSRVVLVKWEKYQCIKWGCIGTGPNISHVLDSFNLHKILWSRHKYYTHFMDEETGTERTYNFLKFTQLVSSRAGIWNWVVIYQWGKLTAKLHCFLHDGWSNATHSWRVNHEYIWWLLLIL